MEDLKQGRKFIRDEYKRLINPLTKEDKLESYNIVIDSIHSIFEIAKPPSTVIHNDGHFLFMMSFFKSHSLLKLYEGITHDHFTTTIIDPFSMWSIVRSQFEAFCWFNNLFIKHTGESQQFLFNLWFYSGLEQRVKSVNIKPDTKKDVLEIIEKETILLNQTKKEILESKLYKGFGSVLQKEVNKAIDRKSFQFVVTDSTFNYLSWRQMILNAGVDEELFGKSYNYLSWFAHPTNVSVFQFRMLYNNRDDLRNAAFALETSKIILCFFIHDFCSLYDEAYEAFNTLPDLNQMLIISGVQTFRNVEYVLNDVLQRYEPAEGEEE